MAPQRPVGQQLASFDEELLDGGTAATVKNIRPV